jgi:hypothetical protein
MSIGEGTKAKVYQVLAHSREIDIALRIIISGVSLDSEHYAALERAVRMRNVLVDEILRVTAPGAVIHFKGKAA